MWLRNPHQLNRVGTVPPANNDHHLHRGCQRHSLILRMQRPPADPPTVLIVIGLGAQDLHKVHVISLQDRRLRDRCQLLVMWKRLRLLKRLDDEPVVGVRHRRTCLRMVPVTEDHHLVPIILELHRNLLHRCDNRAGGVNHLEPARLRIGKCHRPLTMGAHDDRAALEVPLGNVGLGEFPHTQRSKFAHRRSVVDQLPGEIDGLLTRLGSLDRAVPGPLYATTEPRVGWCTPNLHHSHS